MANQPKSSAEQDSVFHTYTTHRIPWYVHVLWIVFLISLVWYIFRFAVPSAKELL